MFIQTAIYFIVNATFAIPQDWRDRLLAKCDTNVSFISFTNASLIEGGAVGIVFGGYVGILSLYESGNVFKPLTDKDTWRIILSLVVALVCILPFALPALLAIGSTNAYLVTICATLLPSFGGGFVLYGFMDRIVDYIWGPAPNIAQITAKDQSEMKLYILKI